MNASSPGGSGSFALTHTACRGARTLSSQGATNSQGRRSSGLASALYSCRSRGGTFARCGAKRSARVGRASGACREVSRKCPGNVQDRAVREDPPAPGGHERAGPGRPGARGLARLAGSSPSWRGSVRPPATPARRWRRRSGRGRVPRSRIGCRPTRRRRGESGSSAGGRRSRRRQASGKRRAPVPSSGRRTLCPTRGRPTGPQTRCSSLRRARRRRAARARPQ